MDQRQKKVDYILSNMSNTDSYLQAFLEAKEIGKKLARWSIEAE
jgi:hypothetical protein